jgi:hypothetical protein
MTDAPRPDDDLELASAYLDGEIDGDDRARVESSPSLLRVVADLAAVRATLARSVPPAAAATRESALAAALAAAAEPAPTADDQVPTGNLRVMPRRYRWVAMAGSAAAAVVLAVVAVTALQGGGSDSDVEVADAPVETATMVGADTRTAAAGAEATPEAMDTENTLGSITGPATVLPEVANADDLTAYATGAAPPMTTFGNESLPGQGTDVTADTLPASEIAPAVSPLVPVPTCLPADATVVGSVSVRGIPATVVRAADGSLQAYDGDCTLLLQAQP